MIDYKKIIYFDAETTTAYKNIEELKKHDIVMYNLFVKRFERRDYDSKYKDINDAYINKAPLFAEFNTVIAFSIGVFNNNGKYFKKTFKIENNDEESLIKNVHEFFHLNKNILNYLENGYIIGGFNIKGFDIPLLTKKFFKYGLEIPRCLKTFNVKPWEMQIVDFFDVWKANGIDFASLEEMSVYLGVNNSKTILENKSVYELFYVDNDLDKIAVYCEGDVESTMLCAEKICKLI